MYITKEKFEEICKKYPTLILSDGDAVDALNFVQDLLDAEVDAVKEREPHATASIERLKAASWEVYDVCSDVDNEEFLVEKPSVDELISKIGKKAFQTKAGQEKENNMVLDL